MTSLRSVDENWQTGLAIVAHPDDLEYGASSAIARWTAQGKTISYVLVTSGEAGIDSVPPVACKPLREAEQRAAAAAVGVQVVEFLGHQDGVVEYGLPLRRDLAGQIRKFRPDVIITSNFRDFWAPGAPNQADHIAVGRAALDAVADAGNRWIFAEVDTDPKSEPLSGPSSEVAGNPGPWNGVQQILSAGSPHSTHGVDITDFLEHGIASLEAHRAYLDGLGKHEMGDARTFLTSMAAQTGPDLDCRYATAFEAYRS